MKLPQALQRKVLEAAGITTAVNRAAVDAVAGPPPADLALLVAAVRAAGHPDPVAEHRFDADRQWRFDLAWPAVKVAFEREGGCFKPVVCDGCGRTRTVFVSRHHSRQGLEADAEKYNAAAACGWAVIRATPGMLADGSAAARLIQALAAKAGR